MITDEKLMRKYNFVTKENDRLVKELEKKYEDNILKENGWIRKKEVLKLIDEIEENPDIILKDFIKKLKQKITG